MHGIHSRGRLSYFGQETFRCRIRRRAREKLPNACVQTESMAHNKRFTFVGREDQSQGSHVARESRLQYLCSLTKKREHRHLGIHTPARQMVRTTLSTRYSVMHVRVLLQHDGAHRTE